MLRCLRGLYLVLEATAVVRLLGVLAHLAAPSPRPTPDPKLDHNPTASTAMLTVSFQLFLRKFD